MCGVFGPSGSGKSTLLRIIAGIETPDSGTVSTLCNQCALSFAEPTVDPSLTPYETLWLYAILYETPRRRRHAAVTQCLLLTDLDSVRDTRVSALSGGMRKQLEVARVLISRVDLILLDEPMAGLDSTVRERLWEHLLSLRSSEGTTIVMATSRPEDAELCDRITLLDQGQVLACGTLAELRSMVGSEAVVIKALDRKKAAGKRPLLNSADVTAIEQGESLVVEMGVDSRPAQLVRQFSGDVAAVRLRPQGLVTILEALAARRSAKTSEHAK